MIRGMRSDFNPTLRRLADRQHQIGRVLTSMGIHIPDLYKWLRLMGDVDTMVADCADLIAAHGLDPDTVRDALAQDMFGAG